ncbi:hypothetical protein DM02DRAFT_615139 [Periconia macrospinosa]|uniref:Uncharacterized protein n=1 Tax=Periconia macrospinosa TaxID=97972 RepID=A0A2V1DNS9_9PLEO|nr:hypothetical protein DM02DRAFT_615139 [Periconia macrospinosa]
MATMATERTLRIITIALFIPALVLCVASGIKTEKTKQGWMGSRPPVSYFGTVPAFLSALTSAVVLYANRSKSLRLGDDARAKTQRAVMLVIDVILAAGYIALLVPLWILDAGIVRWNGVAAMLLAYATMPLLINLYVAA